MIVHTSSVRVADSCPAWCVTEHGQHLGEDDWVHVTAPVAVIDGLTARRCSSVAPGSGAVDGPYVMLGEWELSLDQALALGKALLRMADDATR